MPRGTTRLYAPLHLAFKIAGPGAKRIRLAALAEVQGAEPPVSLKAASMLP
jgi:hypothetical protein